MTAQLYSPPIYINRQSQFYVNTPLKIHSLKLRLKHKFVGITGSLYKQCNQCTTNQCLDKMNQKLSQFQNVKANLETKMEELDKKMNEEYYLCRDLIFENDIRLCRVQVMNKYYEKIIVAVNQSGIAQL